MRLRIKKDYILAIIIFIICLTSLYIFIKLFSQKKLSIITPLNPNLHIEGNHFMKNGRIVILRGASRWSLEFSCGDEHFNTSDFHAMKSWGINIIRLPLNEEFFLYPSLCQDTYQTTVFNAVNAAKSEGLYVILDLHWVHPEEVKNIDERGGQFPMPDNQALSFWRILVNKYKNDSNILFEFMNEPHEVPCSVWKNGGKIVSNGQTKWIQQTEGIYITPGFQRFVNLTRDLGANNIIVQGASGESDLTCVLTYPLSDPVNNIAYQSHFYSTNPYLDWQKKFKKIIDTTPVIAGEYNLEEAVNVTSFFENHLQTGYLFWEWSTYDSINDYSGTPKNPAWKNVHNFILNASILNYK